MIGRARRAAAGALCAAACAVLFAWQLPTSAARAGQGAVPLEIAYRGQPAEGRAGTARRRPLLRMRLRLPVLASLEITVYGRGEAARRPRAATW